LVGHNGMSGTVRLGFRGLHPGERGAGHAGHVPIPGLFVG
jgi:hypothetical protein